MCLHTVQLLFVQPHKILHRGRTSFGSGIIFHLSCICVHCICKVFVNILYLYLMHPSQKGGGGVKNFWQSIPAGPVWPQHLPNCDLYLFWLISSDPVSNKTNFMHLSIFHLFLLDFGQQYKPLNTFPM